MITVTQRPDPIMLSGNPIDVEVLASRPDGSPIVAAGGSRATFTGPPNDGLGDNLFLSLDWTNPEGRALSVGFHTAGPFPTAYAIPAYGGGDLTSYFQQLASAIGSNQEVAPYFNITPSRNLDGSFTITAVAKSNDPAWSVRWEGVDEAAGFTVANNIGGSNDGSYRVRTEIFMDRGNGYEEIGSIGSPPNDSSRLAFDIGRIVDNAVREVLPLPGIPSFEADAPIVGNNVYPYYLRISDFSTEAGYGDDVVIDDRRAFAGKVGGALLSSGNFLEQISTGSSWLCSRPDRRLIGRNEPVFLSWLSPNSSDVSPQLEVEETDDALTVTTRLVYGNVATTNREPITFPVGVVALGIDDATVYYRVRVMNQDVELSPWRTFVVDVKQYEQERYLAYLNSFYLPEVLRCTGDLESELDTRRQEFTRVRQQDGGSLLPGKGTFRVETSEDYTYFTGYKPRLEVVAVVRELVASPYVYQITANGRTPLLPAGRSFDLGNPTNNLFAAVLPFKLAELQLGAAFGSPAGPGQSPPNTGTEGETGGDPGGGNGGGNTGSPGEPGNPRNWNNAGIEWTNAGDIWYNQ